MTTAGRPRAFAAAIPVGLAMMALLLSGLAVAAAEERPEPRRHEVIIDATAYSPRTITARVGDTIVWVNEDLFPHTVTAKSGRWDSGDIPSGGSWSYTVKAEGLFAYFCAYHPTMKATLRVR